MLSRIHNLYDHLSNSEKRIADVILSSPQKAISMTVQDLAVLSGSSPSAVVRFCRSIGTKGFSDFKISLSVSLGEKPFRFEMLPVHEGDCPPQVFR